MSEPIGNMEQLTYRGHRIELSDGSMTVNRLITRSVDDPRLAEHRFAGDRLKRRLVNQRAQVVLIWQAQRSVGLECPHDRQLKGTTRIETRGTRIVVNRCLSLASRLPNCRPFGLEEGEVAHASPPSPICRSNDCRTKPMT